MSAVLNAIGLTADQVSRAMGGAGNAQRPTLNVQLSKRANAKVIPVTGPQVAPVLSDADVERIAKKLAAELKPWMRAPRRDWKRKKHTILASWRQRQGAIPQPLLPLATVCARVFGVAVSALESEGRLPNQSAAKFLLRWGLVRVAGYTTMAADRLLGVSGGSCSKSAYRADEMARADDEFGAKMRDGMKQVREFWQRRSVPFEKGGDV